MSRPALKTAIDKGLAAAKRNRIPALVMWIFGVALIVGYYGIPPIRELLESVGRIKMHWGWVFSLISTALFGGFIPSLLHGFIGNKFVRLNWKIVLSSTLLWAYKGVETDYFYRFQGWMFGTDAHLTTIAIKTLVDQLLWVPLFGLVNVVLFYFWRDNRYSFRDSWQNLGRDWYGRLVLPVMIANWFVWIPAVAMIYALPSALQIPVQNLILCFWVLILIFFTEPEKSPEERHRTLKLDE